MNKKFVLGMLAATVSANSVLAQTLSSSTLSQRIQNNYSQGTSQTSFVDGAQAIVSIIGLGVLNRLYPRINEAQHKKAKAENIALKTRPTVEDLQSQIDAIEKNPANYELIDANYVKGDINSNELGPIKPSVQQQINALNEEKVSQENLMKKIEQEVISARRDIEIADNKIEEIKGSVHSYDSLHIDANKDGTVTKAEASQSTTKLKPSFQDTVNGLENQKTQLTASIEQKLAQAETAKLRIQTINTDVNSLSTNVKNRLVRVLKPEASVGVEIHKKQLAEAIADGFTNQTKEGLVKASDANVNRISKSGKARGTAKWVGRFVVSASGIYLVADIGARGYLVVEHNKNADILSAWTLTCTAVGSDCRDIDELILGKNNDSAVGEFLKQYGLVSDQN